MENFNSTALIAGVVSLFAGLWWLRRSIKTIKEKGPYSLKDFIFDIVSFGVGGNQKALLIPFTGILFGLGGIVAAFIQNH